MQNLIIQTTLLITLRTVAVADIFMLKLPTSTSVISLLLIPQLKHKVDLAQTVGREALLYLMAAFQLMIAM